MLGEIGAFTIDKDNTTIVDGAGSADDASGTGRRNQAQIDHDQRYDRKSCGDISGCCLAALP
jgi:hypothetical protein